jgi:capsular polysaccharide export protein
MPIDENDISDNGINKPARHYHILLLQGPVGPFMCDLQTTIEHAGHTTDHIIFNAGDWLYSSGKNIVNFRKSDDQWEQWLTDYLHRKKTDAIIFFGCERIRHEIAQRIGKQSNIAVLSLDEGYIRPGFIAAEAGGNNRYSPLKLLTTAQLKQKPLKRKPSPTRGHSFNQMTRFGCFYYIARFLGHNFYNSSSHHKYRPVFSEAFFWVRNLTRKIAWRTRNFYHVEELLDSYHKKYYLVPLQVHDDMQLVKAGRGWTNETLIREAIESFSQHAPKSRVLVFKVHPLERGHSTSPKLIEQYAAQNGCKNRVRCLTDGSIGLLTRDCAGMLTINSTSAFSAMLRNVPLGIMGDAMFRRQDLVYCIEDRPDLDGFWRNARPAKAETLRSFRKHMQASALLSGDFYLKKNRLVASQGILARIIDLIEGTDSANAVNKSTR